MALADRIWTEVQTFFVGMFKSTWSGFIEVIPFVLSKVWDFVTDVSNAIEADQWDDMLKMFVDAGMLDEDAAKEIYKLKDVATPLDIVFYFMMFFNLTRTYINETMLASAGDLRKALYSKYTPSNPGSGEVIRAAFVAPELTQEVRNRMKMNGLSDEDIDLMFVANYRLYDENMIRILYLRNVLNEDETFMRMRELGYTDTRIKEIVQSWQVIPQIQDILRMVAREAFEPEMYERLGLNAEFPEEQAEFFEMQGLSRFWQEKYWIAHWEQPSLQMAFEMLHRGVIDEDELDLIYKAVEIPPYWRPKLTAISYLPYTRVDARRMHAFGVLKDEDLIRVYMDQGYDEEHAYNMALFTIRYNAQEQTELNKGEILKAYKQGAMSRSDAKELLLEIGVTEDIAEYYLTFQDFMHEKEMQDDMVSVIGDSYKNRLIERTDAKEKLDTLNLPSQQVTLLLSQWDVHLLKNTKIPSKTDLDKFLKQGIIDRDNYFIEMDKLGYKITYTDWYYKLSTGKKG